eukprot:TRINITY_DN3567_c0_g1_i1.p1 TRINITY_DN3567_c0_g1~~TRINITY_DN3567_c0_g1_i1.p1  ORF type:complete len:387 (+),score=50.52 TRINITY_DN3567_c0_g1_i1:139-1299(+)
MSNNEFFNSGYSQPTSPTSPNNHHLRLQSLLNQGIGMVDPQVGPHMTPTTPTSNEEITDDIQICYDFTKNQCNRGDKCKYSHDIATIIKYNSREKGICFDFLRGQCLRGMLCKFSHDLSNIAHLYQQANYGAVGNNNSTSICYNFLKGVCRDGNTCRYSHDLRVVTTVTRTQSSPAPTQLQAPIVPTTSGLNASDAALALLQLLQGSGGTPTAPLTPRQQSAPSLDQLLAHQQLFGGLDGLNAPGSPYAGVPRLPVTTPMIDHQTKDFLNSPTDVVSSWGTSTEATSQGSLNDLENLVASLSALQAMQQSRNVGTNAGDIDDMLAQIQALQMTSANSMQLDRTSSGSVQPLGMARGSRSMSMGTHSQNFQGRADDTLWRSNSNYNP